jgi:poly(A) polymerase
MTLLPEAPWRSEPGLLRLLDALGGSEMTRAVGGAVRDTLLGLPVSDVDLATKLRPDDVMARLEAAGIKAVPTGIAHGTITAVADGRPYEVTTLRCDVATDGRRATVAFADDWMEDAGRRDFTINALYADPIGGMVHDPVGGLADLAARRVLFIGDAATRIDEDHLRILRWFRFLARFGDGGVDEATLAVVAGRAATLRGLSRERVADELQRILALNDPSAMLALMERAGVLAEIVPEALPDAVARVQALLACEAEAGQAADAGLRLIALLPEDPAKAEQVAHRLKLSKRMHKRIAVARSGTVTAPIRALAYRIGIEGARDRVLLGGGVALAMLTEIDGWTAPKLPIGGGELVAMGVVAGPDVARLLRAVEDRWVAEGFPDRNRTMQIAREVKG